MNQEDVERALLNMGVSDKSMGFKYITDAIMLLDGGWDDVKMSIIYYCISTKYPVKWNTIESVIRRTLLVARSGANRDMAQYYIGFDHPQNGSSLKKMRDVIRKELQKKGQEER